MERGILAFLLLGTAGLCAFAQTISLEEAIQTSAREMGTRLEKGIQIAVLNFDTSSKKMASYVIDEMNNAIVNNGELTVVDRQLLALLRKEIDFNDSGDVSNSSAQQIGRMLGAQMIVSGSIELVGDSYRFRIQVLEVETAAIKYSYSVNIKTDQLVRTLIGGNSGLDYTTGERAGAAALNTFFGSGSFFLQKDKIGGGITAGIEGIGIILAIVGGLIPDYKTTDDFEYVADPTGSIVPPLRPGLSIIRLPTGRALLWAGRFPSG
ncbi:MAG: penicillin-binding protein activator LpoB [Treponema sp.]|nr:penicillin-binding protein activator LpoB [Treponema sp.]